MRKDALRSVVRSLPLVGMALLLVGPVQAAPGLLSVLPLTRPLLTLMPAVHPVAPSPLPRFLTSPRSSWIGSATAMEESLSALAWSARAGWLVSRANDPSLQFTGWDDVFDLGLLGQFAIPLRSDPAERTNILLSAQAVDGVLVDPGQVFSFNGTVGERTPERGYQDGWMFDQGRLIRGTGGGICLVATGLYNAALRAGLGIVERHPHSGLVSYAPPGCDAGVVYGIEDMQFRNTTASPLLVRSRTEDDRIILSLYGHAPPPGEEVIVKPTAFTPLPAPTVQKEDSALTPGQTVVEQKPRDGFDVTVERFWTKYHKVVRREVIAQERRAPRAKIIRVAPTVAPIPATTPTPSPDPLTDLLLGGSAPGDIPADE